MSPQRVMSPQPPLRVLVVDDSALVRQTMLAILTHEGFEVMTAPDPLIALDRMKAVDPDVILLDLEMPRMDGLSFLRKIMSEDPRPVVICSAVAERGSESALRALEEGAVDIILKPQIGVQGFLLESAVMLVDIIRAASLANMSRRGSRLSGSVATVRSAFEREPSASVVAIGASTGGTHALRVVLEEMPADSPAVVMVLHMPRPFTGTFARGLDRIARMEVREAVHGERLVRGVALLAPGDQHMRIVRGTRGGCVVDLFDGPLVSRHRPSVDVLFSSVAAAYAGNAVGVIMTGMGCDGAAGLLEMHQAGAFTIAQDEASCVVFGMPREAIALGAIDRVVPLHAVAASIDTRVRTRQT